MSLAKKKLLVIIVCKTILFYFLILFVRSNKQRIALTNNRRKKVGTALLKACEKLSGVWDYEYLVLRAYEDDLGALELYRNAGYVIVSGDPQWMTSWIGRRRRVLMIKRPLLI